MFYTADSRKRRSPVSDAAMAPGVRAVACAGCTYNFFFQIDLLIASLVWLGRTSLGCSYKSSYSDAENKLFYVILG